MKKKNVKKKRKLNYKNLFIIIKILIICVLIFGFYNTNKTFENQISLLAISEDSNEIVIDGSIINLHLKTKPGSGQTYVNLETINDIDTQISIINSQKIACDLFELDCQNYDFYYDFEGSALVLKGPSASSAIAILTAKTLKQEKLNDNTVITGSLNSGGVMGNVGGVDQKIKTAQQQGFKKAIIPVFSDYNKTIQREIEVIKAIDIIDAYNSFNGKQFIPTHKEIDKTQYQKLMQNLSTQLCARSLELKQTINNQTITPNSTLYNFLEQAQTSFNSSQTAQSKGNYYSQGSFCYNSNLNYRNIIEKQRNLSENDRDNTIKELRKTIQKKYITIKSDEYIKNIQTINDFYVYLLILDRLTESQEFLTEISKLKIEYETNQTTNTNLTDNELTQNLKKPTNLEEIKKQKETLYAYAIERLYTVTLWEEFISHSGEKIKFDDNKISDACLKINREISIKSELLKNYQINFFNEDINKQNQYKSDFSNKYLCIYKGLELSGKINTVLNSIGIQGNDQQNYTKTIMDLANQRLISTDNKNFPLIPYIYLEYSEDLFEEKNYGSAMLYSNFALSYADINLYLEKEDIKQSVFNKNIQELFEMDLVSLAFVIPLLIILGFL